MYKILKKSNSNKVKESGVEIKPPLVYIFVYEPYQKLAYIKYETKMLRLPTTTTSSCHCKLLAQKNIEKG
jgi:hypothetical protein